MNAEERLAIKTEANLLADETYAETFDRMIAQGYGHEVSDMEASAEAMNTYLEALDAAGL